MFFLDDARFFWGEGVLAVGRVGHAVSSFKACSLLHGDGRIIDLERIAKYSVVK